MAAIDPNCDFDTRYGALLNEALGTEEEREFNAITEATSRITGCPISLISVFDHREQWFKARTGFNAPRLRTNGRPTFCRYAVMQDAVFEVPDTILDARFADDPVVTTGPKMRFYAGVPLRVHVAGEPDRVAVGALCVFDKVPRDLADDVREIMLGLGRSVEALIEARLARLQSDIVSTELAEILVERTRLHRQFQQAERMANIGSWRLTLDDHKIEWSEQVYAIHELTPSDHELLSDALRFYPPEDRQLIEDSVARAISTGEPYNVEVDFITAKKNLRRVRAIGELELENGRAIALIGVFQDITERYRLERKLKERADLDELTRIASRRPFNEHLDDLVEAARHPGGTIGLILIDLDNFKATNDRFGHAAGDRVLRRTASLLQADWLMRSFAARLGGDEFVLVLTDPVLLQNVASVAQRLLIELRQTVGAGDDVIEVGATMGIACATGASMSRKHLLEKADQALYSAKRAQRGTAKIDGIDTPVTVSPA